MPDTYPYTISNNKIEGFFNKIRTAARPDRLTRQVLNHWGFTGSNDRAMVPILKGLGFLDENGAPTELYNRLKGDTDWKNLLGDQIRELYSALYATNTDIHNAPDDEVKGAFSRVTGKDTASVNRYFTTFKALTAVAKFDGKAKVQKAEPTRTSDTNVAPAAEKPEATQSEPSQRDTSFHYNIQIHLPATNDISVYNAIFKSLKEHLGI